MKIKIYYESSWGNSFLAGSNNEPPPKKGRKFIGSMTELKGEGNFIRRTMTKDTVMGILNRLIGDQRKLYQSRQDKNYFFKSIEEKDLMSFSEIDTVTSSELIFIRNISGSEDQNSFTGAIKVNDPVFLSAYADELWGVLELPIEELFQFIQDETFKVNYRIDKNPISIIEKLEDLNGLKAIEIKDQSEKALSILKLKFPDVDYKPNAKGEVTPISFYCSALYLQVERLSKKHDLSTALTKAGNLSGISKRGFTKKDFMVRYTTGKKKIIFGNPYMLKLRVKGEGETTSLMTKQNGLLEIKLNIPEDEAETLQELIESAGVSSFYLGKKGLAYVEDIRV